MLKSNHVHVTVPLLLLASSNPRLLSHLPLHSYVLSAANHEKIMSNCLRQLALPGNEKESIRPLSSKSLAALALVMSDSLLDRLVKTLLEKIASGGQRVASGSGARSPQRLQRTASVDTALRVLEGADARTLIRTMGTIAGSVGHRLSDHVSSLVPMFLDCIGSYDPNPENAEEMSDEDMIYINEVREFSFSGLEVFVRCCPNAILPFLKVQEGSAIMDISTSNGKQGGLGLSSPDSDAGSVINCAMDFIKYDPNFVGDDDGSEGGSDEEEDDEYSDGEVYSGGDDDDDSSWKVRRAALKVIRAVIEAHPALNKVVHERCTVELLNRFHERADQVREDVLRCFIALLESTRAPDVTTVVDVAASDINVMRAPVAFGSRGRARSTVPFLVERMGEVLNGFEFLMKPKTDIDLASRGRALELLTKYLEVLRVAPGHPDIPDPLLEKVMSILMASFKNERLNSLRLQQLQLLSMIVECHSASSIQLLVLDKPVLDVLNVIVAHTKEESYRNVATALRLLGILATKLRPSDTDPEGDVSMGMSAGIETRSPEKLPPVFKNMYTAVRPRLEALDLDQEIKKTAIEAMALIVHHGGDLLDTADVTAALHVLNDRIDNEITRVTTLRALTLIANSPVALDLSLVLENDCFSKIANLASQASREVRVCTLMCMDAFVHSVSFTADAFSVALTDTTLNEVASLVSPKDLHLAQLALSLCTSLMEKLSPTVYAASIQRYVYSNAITLAGSPSAQGPTLVVLEQFMSKLVQAHLSAEYAMTFGDLLASLYTSSGSSSVDANAIASRMNLARCVAAICMSATAEQQQAVAQRIAADVVETNPNMHMALLCIGTIGRQTNLSQWANNQDFAQLVISQLASSNTLTQSAAAFALGNLAVGHVEVLDRLLEVFQSGQHSSLLLSAMKELIQVHVQSNVPTSFDVKRVLPTVLDASKSREVQIRSLAAECLGMLSYLNCSDAIHYLGDLFESGRAGADNWHMHWSLATSFKFSVRKGELEPAERDAMASALAWLPILMNSGNNLEVRKAALMATSSVIHRNHRLLFESPLLRGSLVSSTTCETILEAIIPNLLEAMEFVQKITVDTGAFKVVEDLGLPLRTAALTCLDTIIDVIPEKLDVASILHTLQKNIGDELKEKSDNSYLNDMKSFVHRVLLKLCKLSPGSLLGCLEDSFIVPLQATIMKACKAPATDNDIERQAELRRSALRVVLAFSKLEGVAALHRFKGFKEELLKSEVISMEMDTEAANLSIN